MTYARGSLVFALLAALSAAPIYAGCSESATDGESAPADLTISPDLVIAQVYGGGGNTGAPIKNDFVEIFNRGQSAVSLGGKSLQYTGFSRAFSSTTDVVDLPNVMLAPGKSFLVQLAGGAVGAPLVAPDLVMVVADAGDGGSSATNMARDKGKVALVSSTALLDACGTAEAPCSENDYIDLVGYGAVSQAEGSPAPALTNTTAAIRKVGGCQDTGVNAADFTSGPPAPRNSASPATLCASETDAGTADSAVEGATTVDAAQASDGSPADAGTAASLVLLNEIEINPPTGTDSPWEFAELSCEKGASLAGYWFVAFEGDGDSSSGNPGFADVVVDLSSYSCGQNGLVLIKAPTGGHAPQDPATTIVPAPSLQTGAGAFENATTSFVVVKSASPIVQGTDYDPENDGTLDLPGGATVLDGVSTFEQADSAIDHTYAPRLQLGSGGSADGAFRIVGNTTPLSAAAWHGGDIKGTTADSLQIDNARALPGTPANSMLTPGAVNTSGSATPPTGPSDDPSTEPTGDTEDVPVPSGRPSRGKAPPLAPRSTPGCSASPPPSSFPAAAFAGVVLALGSVLARRRRR